jgi:MFS family permease
MDPIATPPAVSGKKPGPLINRNFALLFGGQTISTVGDFVFNITLVLWIAIFLAKGQTWAPLAVSGVLVAASVPVLLVGPLAGVFVDRWDKRRTMLRISVVQAIVVAALLLATGVVALPFVAGGRLPLFWTLGAIYMVVFLVNACQQFYLPSAIALIGDIVPAPERPRATGLTQAIFALATIIGPPLAAPLLIGFGVEWALIIDALSFLVVFVAVLAIRAPKAAVSIAPGECGNFLREFGQGLRFYFSNRVLVVILITGVLIMLGAGALNALDVFFVTQNLHTDPKLYGFVGAALAVGVLVGAALGGALGQRIGLTRMLWSTVLGEGIVLIDWARMTLFVPALVVLFVAGVGQAILNVAVTPLALLVTPRDLIGRVSAVLTPLMTGASLASIALAGYLDSTLLHGFHAAILGVQFGAIDTIFLAAGVMVVLGGLYAMVALRGVTVSAGDAPAEAD